MEKRHLRDIRETLRDEMYIRDKIGRILHQGPKTIPELAEALNMPPHEVVMFVMAMRRFGMVEEMPKSKREDYFHYKLAGQTSYAKNQS